jgi:tetratricopeptide (TPR) repeat protein
VKTLAAWVGCGLLVAAVAHAQSDEAIERNGRGVELMKQNKLAEAAASFKAALDMSPSYVAARANLAFAYEKLGQVDDAIGAYQKVLDADPKNTTVRNNLAVLYSRTGRHEEAVREFEDILRNDPGDETARRNLDMSKRNRAILDERDAQSSRALKEAQARPGDPRAAYDVARVYAQQGDAEKALVWLAKALDLGYDQTEFIKVDPAFTALRKDPRFGKLLEGPRSRTAG